MKPRARAYLPPMKKIKLAKKRATPKSKSKVARSRATPKRTAASTRKPKRPTEPPSQEKRDELVGQLGRAILGDEDLQPKGWTHLVLVVRYYSETHNRVGGWCYMASDDYEPVAPDGNEVIHAFTALRDEMARVDQKKPWKACLLRLARATREIDIDFEYKNVERWDPGREHLTFLKFALGLAS